jgi:hypothetical protein
METIAPPLELPEPDVEERCRFCDYTTLRKDNMRRHERTKHLQTPKPFSCGQCPYGASSASDLRVHERRHTGDKPFPCSFCGFRSSKSGNTKAHERRVHGFDPTAVDGPEAALPTGAMQLNDYQRNVEGRGARVRPRVDYAQSHGAASTGEGGGAHLGSNHRFPRHSVAEAYAQRSPHQLRRGPQAVQPAFIPRQNDGAIEPIAMLL